MKLPPSDALLHEVRIFIKDLETHPGHVVQVAKLADRLFVLLKPLHGLGARDRKLLAAAALMHDIGWSESPSGKAHHKHSARLIRRNRWVNLSAGEIDLVAQTARYHRRKLPTLKHKPFARLDRPERRRVCALAALLRIADALDRSQSSLVWDLGATLAPGAIRLTAFTRKTAREEEYAFLKKRDLFVDHFDSSIELQVKYR